MQHGRKNRKFGRTTKQRSALLKSLIVSLVRNKKIVTTTAKAKSLKVEIEKLLNRAKIKNLSNTKYLLSEIGVKFTNILVNDVAPKYMDTNGGYTRIKKMPSRLSDGADMSLIEFK